MASRPRLKICGVTNPQDARLVGASGADYCGILIDVGFSERSLSLSQAKQVASASAVPVVVLLSDPDAATAEKIASEIQPYAVQLLCCEAPELLAELKSRLSCRVWKTVHLPPPAGEASPQQYAQAGADALVVDNLATSDGVVRYGGTGRVVDWQAAAALVQAGGAPVFLAGGLNPDNIEQAILQVRPYGIDLCSGVEAAIGRKDPQKLRSLIERFDAAVTKLEKGSA